jgi:hypothetical protein
MKISISIVLLLFLGGTAVVAQKPSTKPRARTQDEIVSAVVRYATRSQKGIVFLSVDGHDPSTEILRLLSTSHVQFLPASQAVYVPVPNEIGNWKDKKSGQLGSYFECDKGALLDSGRAEVSAGWDQPCGTFTVVLQNAVWSVEAYKAWEFCF